jgi:hypothetical protein
VRIAFLHVHFAKVMHLIAQLVTMDISSMVLYAYGVQLDVSLAQVVQTALVAKRNFFYQAPAATVVLRGARVALT